MWTGTQLVGIVVIMERMNFGDECGGSVILVGAKGTDRQVCPFIRNLSFQVYIFLSDGVCSNKPSDKELQYPCHSYHPGKSTGALEHIVLSMSDTGN